MKQVVAALMLRESKILICQRTPNQPFALQWEFPGGKVEPEESPVAALARELEEELGIRAEIGPEVSTIQHTYKNGNAVELHFYRVDKFSGEIQNRIFHAVRWVERAQLANYDFLTADLALVREISAGKII
jgi:8-oxo-dGTP diphosphatase